AYAENKRARRKELQAIADFVLAEAKGATIIFGGDFNIPPDHTVTDSLQPDLSDSFKASGRGWGATAVNDYPMVRIDQIWTSKHLEPVMVSSKKTRHSDHRMVIADFAGQSR
ncbi:MAG: endonuclease/exonuclease/phosphatase family protein, partial [Armatimonadota bacterium]|nr:endonuclease/exonuclease/phosphatase family protein [Armatimonadota bacterium]